MFPKIVLARSIRAVVKNIICMLPLRIKMNPKRVELNGVGLAHKLLAKFLQQILSLLVFVILLVGRSIPN
jgi:hypothetical protein